MPVDGGQGSTRSRRMMFRCWVGRQEKTSIDNAPRGVPGGGRLRVLETDVDAGDGAAGEVRHAEHVSITRSTMGRFALSGLAGLTVVAFVATAANAFAHPRAGPSPLAGRGGEGCSPRECGAPS